MVSWMPNGESEFFQTPHVMNESGDNETSVPSRPVVESKSCERYAHRPSVDCVQHQISHVVGESVRFQTPHVMSERGDETSVLSRSVVESGSCERHARRADDMLERAGFFSSSGEGFSFFYLQGARGWDTGVHTHCLHPRHFETASCLQKQLMCAL